MSKTSVSKFPVVDIYTDGSCFLNKEGKPGGWGVVLLSGKHTKTISGQKLNTTNNEMELNAIYEGLKALKVPCNVRVYSDSQYCIGACSGENRVKANRDLIFKIIAESKKHKIHWIYVPAHMGHQYNELADKLAKNAAVNGVVF